MQAIFVRHGEKQSEYEDDSPLNTRGLAQATSLLKLTQNKELPLPTNLLASEKIRTTQTLAALRDHYPAPLARLAELNPRLRREPAEQFLRRAENVIKQIEQMDADKCVYVCTHIDVMGAILRVIGYAEDSFLSVGSYVHAHFQDGFWIIVKKGELDADS